MTKQEEMFWVYVQETMRTLHTDFVYVFIDTDTSVQIWISTKEYNRGDLEVFLGDRYVNIINKAYEKYGNKIIDKLNYLIDCQIYELETSRKYIDKYRLPTEEAR